MSKLKKHWPIILWIVIAIILPIRQIKIPFLSRNFISWGYFVLFYIVPICLLITGIWYGATAGWKKYLFIPLPFIIFFLNDVIAFQSAEGWFDGIGFDEGWYYAFIGLYSHSDDRSFSIGFVAIGIVLTVVFAIGLLIGECFRQKVKKNQP